MGWKIWSAAVSIDVTDEPSLVREMALAGCTGVFIGFESLTGTNLDAACKKTPRPEDYACRVSTTTGRRSSSARSTGSNATGSSARPSTS